MSAERCEAQLKALCANAAVADVGGFVAVQCDAMVSGMSFAEMLTLGAMLDIPG